MLRVLSLLADTLSKSNNEGNRDVWRKMEIQIYIFSNFHSFQKERIDPPWLFSSEWEEVPFYKVNKC